MQTRNKSFLLRLTEQEYATLKRKSELAGLKMNPFLVSLINGCEIHPRTPDSCKALARQVAEVGNNLNQLARKANAEGYTSVFIPCRTLVIEIDNLVNRIRL